MLLTPPDVISQTLLAVPMWLLFEIGVIFSRILIRKRETIANELSENELDDEFERAIAEDEKLKKSDNSEPAKPE